MRLIALFAGSTTSCARPSRRRAAEWLLVAALLSTVGVHAATASSKWVERTVTLSYSGAGGFAGEFGRPPVIVKAGAWVRTKGRETIAKVSAHDAANRPVTLAVEYVPRGRSASVTRVWCGRSPWLQLSAGTRLRSEVLVGPCEAGVFSSPTTGSITYALRHKLVVSRPRPSTVPPSRRWAVIIGISHYTSPTHPTYGGDGDAAAVKRALLHSGWRANHILVLRDADASTAAIRRSMAWLVGQSGPATFTLFHYSGHVCISSRGPCAAGHTYLWGADNGFIAENDVDAELSRLRGHAWIDIAGCEAGAFAPGLASPSRLFTASSQPGRTSYEVPDWHESVWGGFLWDHGYDRGAASGGRQYAATVGAMMRYAVRNTKASTRDQSRGQQQPFVAGGDRSWRLFAPPA